jgi:hypothetical protein
MTARPATRAADRTRLIAVVAVLAAAWSWGTIVVSYDFILDGIEVEPVTVVAIRG